MRMCLLGDWTLAPCLPFHLVPPSLSPSLPQTTMALCQPGGTRNKAPEKLTLNSTLLASKDLAQGRQCSFLRGLLNLFPPFDDGFASAWGGCANPYELGVNMTIQLS